MLACAAVLLSGCATLVNTRHQFVNVTSTPPGATCRAVPGPERTPKDPGLEFVTPSTVPLNRMYAHYTVTCTAPGKPPQSVTLPSSPTRMDVWNFLFLPGFFVDAYTNAGAEFSPQVHVDIPDTAKAP